MILTAFDHHAGVHCASTALCDVLRFYGCDLTEPLAFGLGAGCGVQLHEGSLRTLPPQPRRFFTGRSRTFEADLCAALGCRLTRLPRWQDGLQRLSRGHPVMAYTDLFELKYLGAHGHWGGHLVAVAGLDGTNVYLADNERPKLEAVPLEQFLAAVRAGVEPDPGAPYYAAIEGARPVEPAQLAQIAVDAIARQAKAMLNDGLPTLELLARELPAWSKLPDWQRCARMGAQVIELRGNGGGLFRQLYARFLDECARTLGLSFAAQLIGLAQGAAAAWTGLAQALTAVQQMAAPDFAVASQRAAQAYRAEKMLWTQADTLFGGAAGW